MAPKENSHPQAEPLKWHPVFFDAIHLELLDYRNSLEFLYEYQLTSEPLRVDTVIIKKPPEVPIGAYIDVILRANSKMIREVLNMSDGILTLEAVLEEAGLVAKYEARGEEKTRCEIARNLLSLGWTIVQTAQTSRLPVEKVQAFYAAIHTNGD
jgi:hypothetical protein